MANNNIYCLPIYRLLFTRFSPLALALLIGLGGCTYGSDVGPSSTLSDGKGPSGDQNQAGVITAGEWNDLYNWEFWTTILAKKDYNHFSDYWGFYTTSRIAVRLTDPNGQPVADARLRLLQNGTPVFASRTDNLGKAELWPDLFQGAASSDLSTLSIDINEGTYTIPSVKLYAQGINELTIAPARPKDQIEIAFVVDATGSMADELEFFKTELLDVIRRVKIEYPQATVATSSVFYRDEGDEYVTRLHGFTEDPQQTITFIQNQYAGGGGDFPEAVHTALQKAVNDLQWSTSARTRLLFLMLDAPPHYRPDVLAKLHASTAKAAQMGIKIIPITASGIDKQTEFLMRFMAISTNGTYVFVTDHSGIGERHLEPTVGEYQVEYLNNLMVRLISKYAQ